RWPRRRRHCSRTRSRRPPRRPGGSGQKIESKTIESGNRRRSTRKTGRRQHITNQELRNMVRVDEAGKSNSLIQARDLDKTYRRGGEEIHVLRGLNLDVDKGDFVAFMGPSGSGKTTLLNLLGGLDVPTRGSITVAGDEITHMSRGKLTDWRARHVGFIFQMY